MPKYADSNSFGNTVHNLIQNNAKKYSIVQIICFASLEKKVMLQFSFNQLVMLIFSTEFTVHTWVKIVRRAIKSCGNAGCAAQLPILLLLMVMLRNHKQRMTLDIRSLLLTATIHICNLVTISLKSMKY